MSSDDKLRRFLRVVDVQDLTAVLLQWSALAASTRRLWHVADVSEFPTPGPLSASPHEVEARRPPLDSFP